MLQLKPWTELPTPRHLLDENDDLDEKEAGFILQYESWSKVEGKPSTPIATLFVAAPRFARYADATIGPEIGRIITGTTKNPIQHRPSLAEADLYELPPELEEGVASTEILHETSLRQFKDSAVVVIPQLEPRDCYDYTTALLSLAPKRVVLLTAASVNTPQSIYKLSTTKDNKKVNLPTLQSPAMLSGPIASIISRCEREGIPATAVVVRGDGPVGHEYVDFDSLAPAISHALDEVWGQGLKPKLVHDTSIYI